MSKSADAFRTISEVADILETPTHVLRFWESRFPQVKPVKRAGGRRYYRPDDVALLGGIKRLLHEQGLAIRGVQKILKDEGVRHVMALSGLDLEAVAEAEASASRDTSRAVAELLAVPVPPAPEPEPEPDTADWPEAEGTDAPAAEAPEPEPEAPTAPAATPEPPAPPGASWPAAAPPAPSAVVSLFPADPEDRPAPQQSLRTGAKRPPHRESGWHQTSLFDEPQDAEPLIEPGEAQDLEAAAEPPAPPSEEAPMALDVAPPPEPDPAVAQIVSLMVGRPAPQSDEAPAPTRPPLCTRLRALNPAALSVGERTRLLAAYDRLEALRDRLQQPPRATLG